MSTVERVSADDLMQLATDVGRVPMQVGAVLVLGDDGGLEPADISAAIDERTRGMRRLRQRLVRVPFGCGRPVWLDDAGFSVDAHVRVRSCPPPGDEAALLRAVMAAVAEPLPADRPLWSATIVRGARAGTAVVVTFHHVLADGIGGLAVLAGLVDGVAVPEPPGDVPRPAPTVGALVVDALSDRLAALGHLPGALHRLGQAARGLRSSSSGRAPASSLNRPTGPRRELALVRLPLADVRAAGRAVGATVNDVVLTGVTGALGAVLAERGERVDQLVVSVPVAGRAEAGGGLGNQVGVMPVALPTAGAPAERLVRVAAITRAHKATARSSSTALVVPAFRALGAVGVLGWLVDHQTLVNTFVTNLRGPDEALSFLGMPIEQVAAVSGTAGNVTVAFAVLSYAGTLTITVVDDPGNGVPADAIARRLDTELRALVPR